VTKCSEGTGKVLKTMMKTKDHELHPLFSLPSLQQQRGTLKPR
jgi:hypothetical protein